jgi:hypothetical protein
MMPDPEDRPDRFAIETVSLQETTLTAGKSTAATSKETGTEWEDVAENKMLRYVREYEKEATFAPSIFDPEGDVKNRRVDFVIRDRETGVPQALVEVKGGQPGQRIDMSQIRDEIQLAADITERKMLIVATPGESLDHQFGAGCAQKMRDYAEEKGVTLIHKRIGHLPDWTPVREKLGKGNMETAETQRSEPAFQDATGDATSKEQPATPELGSDLKLEKQILSGRIS